MKDKGGGLFGVGQEALETSLSHAKFYRAFIIHFSALFAVKFLKYSASYLYF